MVIQGQQSALLDKSDYRWEVDSYMHLTSIAFEWHEATKTRRDQAFRMREPELRVREQDSQPETGEVPITCEVTLFPVLCPVPILLRAKKSTRQYGGWN